MSVKISRMLLACMVAVLALGIALPAQAHHKDAKQNRRINRLLDRTQFLSPDGLDYFGFVYDFGCEGGAIDDADFYDTGDGFAFFLACPANAPDGAGVDAITTNRQRLREDRAERVEEFLRAGR